MHFTGTLYRMGTDADSPLIEITQGCTHNKCKFCNMYKNVPFKMSPMEWIEEDLKELKKIVPNTRKLYFVGANPFVLSYDKMKNVLEKVHEYLPYVNHITMFSRVTDVMNKSVEELTDLRNRGIVKVHLGTESGDDWTLSRMNKGYEAKDIVEQCHKLDKAGITYTVTFLNGLSDIAHSKDHAIKTAQIFNQLNPEFVGSGSLVLFPDVELTQEVEAGKFTPVDEKQMMEEFYSFLENLDLDCELLTHGFTSAAKLNGNIKDRKQEMLHQLSRAIDNYENEKEYRKLIRSNIRTL